MSAIRTYDYFFPPPPIFLLVGPPNWRDRLRVAVERTGKKHATIADSAGIDPATLSRILNGHMQPTFDTVVRLARAVNESVGWLLEERGFALSADEQQKLRDVVRFLNDALLANTTPRDRGKPNAVPTLAEIPRAYAVRGARLVYEAAGDSMIGAGIADRDLLFVKPTRSMREAMGRIVVCRIGDAEYVRLLDVRGTRIRLLSRNERHAPINVVDNSELELIGIVVGRIGAVT